VNHNIHRESQLFTVRFAPKTSQGGVDYDSTKRTICEFPTPPSTGLQLQK